MSLLFLQNMLGLIFGIIFLVIINVVIRFIIKMFFVGTQVGYNKLTEPADALKKVERDVDNALAYSDMSNEQAKRYRNIQLFGTCFIRYAMLVAKADGVVEQSEIHAVFNFFNGADPSYIDNLHKSLAKDFKKPESIDWEYNLEVAKQLFSDPDFSDYDTLLLNGLLSISAADGKIDPVEIKTITDIMLQLGWNANRIKTFINQQIGKPETENKEDKYSAARKILGVSQNAKLTEIKKAYRKLAKQYHPDIVAHMGDKFRKAAEHRFRKINEAYEMLRQSNT